MSFTDQAYKLDAILTITNLDIEDFDLKKLEEHRNRLKELANPLTKDLEKDYNFQADQVVFDLKAKILEINIIIEQKYLHNVYTMSGQ